MGCHSLDRAPPRNLLLLKPICRAKHNGATARTSVHKINTKLIRDQLCPIDKEYYYQQYSQDESFRPLGSLGVTVTRMYLNQSVTLRPRSGFKARACSPVFINKASWGIQGLRVRTVAPSHLATLRIHFGRLKPPALPAIHLRFRAATLHNLPLQALYSRFRLLTGKR